MSAPVPIGAQVVADPEELVDLYRRDIATHIYALADLEEPFWSASTWWRRGDAVVGLVGLPEGDTVVYAVSSADPTGTLALLADLGATIPPGLVTGPTGVADVFAAAGRPLAWSRSYHRFALPHPQSVHSLSTTLHVSETGQVPTSAKPAETVASTLHVSEVEPWRQGGPVSEDAPQLVALGIEDEGALRALYGQVPGAAFFLPSMLTDDTFVGIRKGDGEIIAAAGTHVFSHRHRAAAIGAVFVAPSARGRGFGEMVTRGVLDRLSGRVDTIGLNCTVANTSARRIYAAIGFEELFAYDECEISAGRR